MEVLDFEREYADFAEQVRNVANEIQYNVTAESEAINKYTNLKACIQHSTLDAELKEAMLEDIDEIISEELKHQNMLQEIYSELTGIVAEDDENEKTKEKEK